MAEKNAKSKLKRKKLFVEDHQAEISSKGTLNRSHNTGFPSSETTAAPGRPAVPAGEWWNREQLPAAESLWAQTLKSALPFLENQRCHLVPDLPLPSTSKPTALNLENQRWCDLTEEVAPFPDLSPPSQMDSSSSDPVGLSSSQPPPSVQTQPVTSQLDRQLSSYSRQSYVNATSPQGPSKRSQPSLHSQAKPASSPSPSPSPSAAAASDGRVSMQEKGTNKETAVGDTEESQKNVRQDGEGVTGGGLQSCPMCLLVFPAGFTQMDCDGHLAQCLSEVNMDVTW